ncbi:hypothetical protein BOTBODRAFT_139808 [Botryobasidium botryosum FD-172 SS1]|uniref:Polyketide synthase-like phosphopantetheine-binding domain-containing protein n=1 Tax=Botryobasidium botryosum (strain FD-172 SS1) TaxID=930990 RepID=A0A067LWT3_BOTB1|nr:hypothetical protein BOTBODRAFT_139808 [Botryobasidium botryosum FD-172 SS1]
MENLPLPPTPQGVGSKTFTPPLLDGSITFPQMIDHHLELSPKHPFFRFKPTASSSSNYDDLLWGDVARAIHRAARFIREHATSALTDPTSVPVIAVLSAADPVTYFTFTHGVIRAGYQVFLLSHHNSPTALAHLLVEAGTTHLFISNDLSVRNIGRAALDLLKINQPGYSLHTCGFPRFQDLYPSAESDVGFEPLMPMETPSLDSTIMILHSSGSTSFPKPIKITHRSVLEWARIPWYGGSDLCGEVLGMHALPWFHAYANMVVAGAATSGFICAIFPPGDRSPPALSPVSILKEMVATDCTVIISVARLIEEWACDSDAVAALTRVKCVVFAGVSLKQDVGNFLSSSGVSLTSLYGITEAGPISKFFPASPAPEDWEYFEFSHHTAPFLQPQEDAAGTFEVFFPSISTHTPAVLNANIKGKPAYATNDLVGQHPKNPALYKIVGRVDDQIILSTSEKTNPGPLEDIIKYDPMIKNAVMFGRERYQNGVLIEPKKEYEIDPADLEALASFRNAIWESVERANAYGPSHSRIFKEMIVVTNSSKPFLYTAKGSIKRQLTIDHFQEEIEATYRAVENAVQTSFKPPVTWDYASVLEFVRKVVFSDLGHELKDDDDIFQHGGDSLLATHVRNTILHALRENGISVAKITQNLVYSTPTILGLARYVSSIGNPSNADAVEDRHTRTRALEDMVTKYTSDFPIHNPTALAPASEVVLLTGSTGSLGSAVLAHLVTLSSVSRIYAFNRKSRDGTSIRQRQLKSLESQGLNANIVDSPKVILVEGDTAAKDLGIPSELYDEIRNSITLIILNAWHVDFKLTLPSFEPLIRGARNLIDLALASPHPTPPRVLFTSSISVVMKWDGSCAVPEDFAKHTTVVADMGYGESKWVAERILQIAGEVTALQPVIARIGQISGGANGFWNQSEWLPCIVRSGQVLGVLPQAQGDVSWLPLPVAAIALVEMRNSPYGVIHLCHPRPVSWSSIFTHIASSLGAEMVPFADWLRRLEGSLESADKIQVEEANRNPALMFLDTFQQCISVADSGISFRDAIGFPMLETTRAVEVAHSLRAENLNQLRAEDVEQWLAYWRRSGFLHPVQLLV